MADKKRILVVDDEPDVLQYLATFYQDNGYDVVTAKDGDEATQRFQSDTPDLISLDISMPGKTGVRFYREMKENPVTAGVPIIIVTAITGYGDDKDAFKNFISTRKQVPPPEGFISKPVDTDELLATVKKLIG